MHKKIEKIKNNSTLNRVLILKHTAEFSDTIQSSQSNDDIK
jgi:hypothetical protein